MLEPVVCCISNLHLYEPVSVICPPHCGWAVTWRCRDLQCHWFKRGENTPGEESGLVTDLVFSSSAFITYPVNACNFSWGMSLCHHQWQKKLSCEVGTRNSIFQMCVSFQVFIQHAGNQVCPVLKKYCCDKTGSLQWHCCQMQHRKKHVRIFLFVTYTVSITHMHI